MITERSSPRPQANRLGLSLQSEEISRTRELVTQQHLTEDVIRDLKAMGYL